MSNQLDAIDLELLRLLQADAALSNADLGDKLSLTVTASWRRKKRLEELGYITAYQAVLSRQRLGLGVIAFVEVRFGDQSGQGPEQFEHLLQVHPEILSCHEVTGDADYILTVVANDLESYGRFMEKVIRRYPGVVSIRSSLGLREVKATRGLPI